MGAARAVAVPAVLAEMPAAPSHSLPEAPVPAMEQAVVA
jgi:hypothetical protein